ncbi:MAG: hypothetical protein IJ071_11445 [Ruminococcus sp.]|nr:hypothetical protein [Ruminococcus sp.]
MSSAELFFPRPIITGSITTAHRIPITIAIEPVILLCFRSSYTFSSYLIS